MVEEKVSETLHEEDSGYIRVHYMCWQDILKQTGRHEIITDVQIARLENSEQAAQNYDSGKRIALEVENRTGPSVWQQSDY